MAKPTAPLLSFDAGGQVAKTIVYSRWRGIPVTRKYVIPGNPRTTKQTEVRDIFRTLNNFWLHMPAVGLAPWNAYAVGKPLLGRNAFVGQNVRVLNDDPPLNTMAAFIGSPGARGGLPPENVILAPAADAIAATITPPTPPDGWSVNSAAGIAFPDQAPAGEFVGPIVGQSDAVAPYSLAFTGLTLPAPYVVSVWLVWNKPDGSLAYSISTTGLATPS